MYKNHLIKFKPSRTGKKGKMRSNMAKAYSKPV